MVSRITVSTFKRAHYTCATQRSGITSAPASMFRVQRRRASVILHWSLTAPVWLGLSPNIVASFCLGIRTVIRPLRHRSHERQKAFCLFSSLITHHSSLASVAHALAALHPV